MARLRVEKVQEAIKQELSKMLLMDIKDPRIQFVTITGVELTDDMSIAKVYVSLYGPEKDHEAAWQGLLLPKMMTEESVSRWNRRWKKCVRMARA